jgi:hypothetical protein
MSEQKPNQRPKTSDPAVSSSVLLEQAPLSDGRKCFIMVPLSEAGELLRKRKLSGTVKDLRHLRSLIKTGRTCRT